MPEIVEYRWNTEGLSGGSGSADRASEEMALSRTKKMVGVARFELATPSPPD